MLRQFITTINCARLIEQQANMEKTRVIPEKDNRKVVPKGKTKVKTNIKIIK